MTACLALLILLVMGCGGDDDDSDLASSQSDLETEQMSADSPASQDDATLDLVAGTADLKGDVEPDCSPRKDSDNALEEPTRSVGLLEGLQNAVDSGALPETGYLEVDDLSHETERVFVWMDGDEVKATVYMILTENSTDDIEAWVFERLVACVDALRADP